MASSVLGVNSFVFAMPAAFAVRVWLLTSEPIAIASSVLIIGSCLIFYNLAHNTIVNSALNQGLGDWPTGCSGSTETGKFWGEGAVPQFAKAIEGLGRRRCSHGAAA